MTTEIPQFTLPVPSRQDPENFSARADQLVAELPAFVDGANALAVELNNLVTNFGYAATSGTSNTVDTSGPKTFVVGLDKSYLTGQFILIASTASPENYIVGQISTYDAETGELMVSADKAAGGGTFSDWSLSLTLSVAEANFITAEANRAETEANRSEAAADLAQLGRDIYSSTADALSNGVNTVAITSPGTGGTDGHYVVPVTGTTGTLGSLLIVISGNVLTEAYVRTNGINYSGTLSANIDSVAGTTGAAVSLTSAVNRAVGEFFGIPSAASTGYIDLYTVLAGPVASYTGRTLPSAQALALLSLRIDQLISDNPMTVFDGQVPDDQGKPIAYAITDKNGGAVWLIRPDGSIEHNGIVHEPENVQAQDYAYAILDAAFKLAFGINLRGGVEFAGVGHEDEFIGEVDFTYAVLDSVSRVAFGVNKRGGFALPSTDYDEEYSPEFVYGITDSEGRLCFGVRKDGTVFANGLSGSTTVVEQVASGNENVQADIIQGFNYGQSLTQNNHGSPVLSSVQPFGNIKFNGGLYADDDALGLASFIDLTEEVGETQSSSAANSFIEYIENEEAIEFGELGSKVLMSNPGDGGKKIQELSKGTQYYDYILTQIQAARDIAQTQGQSHNVYFTTYIQGEANYNDDMPRETFKTHQITLIDDLNTDAALITGQSFRFPMISYQVASHRQKLKSVPLIALAQLDATIESADIFMATPMYIFDYEDNLHTNNDSNKHLGRYIGKALKRIAYDKVDWDVVRPIAVQWQGVVIDITFNVPTKPLAFDNTWVAQEINQGFDVWDENYENLLDIIDSVSLVGQDRVRIVLSSEPADGSHLAYAFGRDSHNGYSGRTQGARGNLRDSEGDNDSYIDDDVLTRRMDNYAAIFEITKG